MRVVQGRSREKRTNAQRVQRRCARPSIDALSRTITGHVGKSNARGLPVRATSVTLLLVRGIRTIAKPAAVALLVLVAGSTVSVGAHAEPPPPELMARLAVNAANFERMRTHASFKIAGRMEDIDRDGAAGSVKEMNARIVATGDGEPTFVVDRYFEDGEDKTSESQERADERARERKRKPAKKREIRIPTLATEQPRYVFDVVAVDAAHPSRIKLSFAPKVKEEQTIEGSAWVDAERGVVLSAGFKLARTSMFVSYVHVKVLFGEEGPLGPAITKVDFEGEGGVLFVRKHFRGTATLSNYKLAR